MRFLMLHVKTQFQLSITADKRLCSDVKPFDVPVSLLHVLDSNVPLALAIDTENDRINSGLPQCLTEMIAAQQFNTPQGNGIETVIMRLTELLSVMSRQASAS